MKRIYVKILLLFIPIILFILQGCVPLEIVDEIQLINAVGYDKEENNEIRGTATYPIYNPDGTIDFESFSAVSHTSRFIFSKLNTKSPKQLKNGQLRVVVFNDRFAQDGVLDIVNSLYRNPSVGNRLYMVVAEGSSKEILTKKYGSSPIPAMYLRDLIEQNIKTENLPETNLHVFLYDYYGEGLDPFLPLVKAGKDTIQLDGIALFRGDKYVGKLNHRESFIFKVLIDGSRTGQYEINLKKGKNKGYAVIRNIKGTTNYHVKKVNGIPEFHIDIKILGEIHEYPPWLNLELPANIKLIEDTFKKDVDKQSKEMMKKFQQLHIDPLGLGDQVRRREKYWNFKDFEKNYRKLKIKVSTNIDIVESGVIE
ncbi:Ger(x)C family spore germination protein [Bacillus sp. NEB1478]|uniref:Ger(x)C family spore germination protein n=1 Tax=Bacillus sp. NEB1478 TaxID=3073816 RepID=UPI002872E315|nr:Ger(x)C family spore germination protein [Bacillus sp. NEB1478]WNB92894.1 Ger(x)C family spore germination protein [Bacillus sp. NEB1478]